MAAEWLRGGGWVGYTAIGQSPAKVRSRLKRHNVIAEQLEKDDKLAIFDAYSATLGKKSVETYNAESLKVQDLSIVFSQVIMKLQHEPESLRIIDNGSVLARYNDEKSFVEFVISRVMPVAPAIESTALIGIISGLHSEWVYKNIEASVDGIIDFRLDEAEEEVRDLVRIRTMHDVGYDKHWHQLKIAENFEITIEK
jgi:KaiC/GvpD/RAD55 family RecA-like ATPase